MQASQELYVFCKNTWVYYLEIFIGFLPQIFHTFQGIDQISSSMVLEYRIVHMWRVKDVLGYAKKFQDTSLKVVTTILNLRRVIFEEIGTTTFV